MGHSKYEMTAALIMDLDQLDCVEGLVTDFDGKGCRILSDRADQLGELVGIRLEGMEKMIRGRITARSVSDMWVTFEFSDQENDDKRKEPRRAVNIAAQVSGQTGTKTIDCMIVDASKSGCRLVSSNTDQVPEKLLIYIEGVKTPLHGQVVWRSNEDMGVELLWQFSGKNDLGRSEKLH